MTVGVGGRTIGYLDTGIHNNWAPIEARRQYEGRYGARWVVRTCCQWLIGRRVIAPNTGLTRGTLIAFKTVFGRAGTTDPCHPSTYSETCKRRPHNTMALAFTQVQPCRLPPRSGLSASRDDEIIVPKHCKWLGYRRIAVRIGKRRDAPSRTATRFKEKH